MSEQGSYFVTGGEGFIGYHFCQELCRRDADQVVTYDAQKHWIRMPKSRWSRCLSHRLDELDDQEVVTRVDGDVTDRGLLREALETHRPDVVVHFAALPLAGTCAQHPEAARRNILEGTHDLIDALHRADFDVSRLVYISSSMVYGDFETDEAGDVIPATEGQVCEPKGLYGAFKLGGEHVVRSYGHQFGVPYTIVRPSAVYGPTDCNRRVVELFLRRALEGKSLRLDNGGYHELDFTYVSDLVEGVAQASNHGAAENETFNLTRGEGRSIRELAEVIREYVPGTGTHTAEQESTRPRRGALDISKARDRFGYSPTVSLEEGIGKYLEFVERTGLMESTSGRTAGDPG